MAHLIPAVRSKHLTLDLIQLDVASVAAGSTFKTALYKERVTAHEAAQKGGAGKASSAPPVKLDKGPMSTSTAAGEGPSHGLGGKTKGHAPSSAALAVVGGIKKRTFDVGGSKDSDWQGWVRSL